MAHTRTFRVFVSSTFSDLNAERNALQERVFPRLRDKAAEHGCRFQPIDLRWGVSDEASLDQQAMNICLGEIARCQQTSPRPNFIVLLGDRYGWCPPASQIPEAEFSRMLEATTKPEDRALLEKWYFHDQNAVKGEWKLRPRQRGSEVEPYEGWQPVELRLHAILADAAGKLGLPPEKKLPVTASATEQEISAGALTVKEAPEHVLCFFRTITGLPEQFSAVDFQARVEARLSREFPDGLSTASQAHMKAVKEMDASSTAKDFSAFLADALDKTPKATTEQEVLKAIRQVLVDMTARDYLNLDETDWTIDRAAHANQVNLKDRLQAYVPANVKTYQAEWTGEGISTDHIDRFCEDVYASLEKLILDEIDHPHEIAVIKKAVLHIQPDEHLDAEGLLHHRFAEDRLEFFVGRSTMLSNIHAHLQSNSNRCLAIMGKGGTGKSALMARLIQQTREVMPAAEVVYRFIGATPGSSDGRSLLESLCHEISRRYDAETGTIPTDYRDLVPELGKRMKLAKQEQRLVLFLDSLDQLSASQEARSLIWLPAELPEGVAVIVSTRDEDTFKAMQAKQALVKELGGLERQEGDDLLTQWLSSVRRDLQPSQKTEVLDKFIQSDGNPLYLKLAFEEARLWTSDPELPQEKLEIGVEGIIAGNMIHRLKHEGNHGEALVSHALGYLAASRHGLAEDEMLDLLSRDLQVYAWFFKKSYHLPADLLKAAISYRQAHGLAVGKEKTPAADEAHAAAAWLKEIRIPPEKDEAGTSLREERAAADWLKEDRNPPEKVAEFLMEVLPKADGPRLPVVLWSRLSFDLAPYLSERLVDGSPLLNFYHRELGDVSKATFLANGADKTYHERLGDYFRFKADPKVDKNWNGKSIHGLSELPYHLTQAGRFEDVFQVLTDFKFLEHKAAEVGILERKDEKGNIVKTYTGVLQLQEDYEDALKAMPGGEGEAGDRAPLILTALDTSKGLMVYCPVCNKHSPITREMLDKVIACPQEGCKAPIKLNPFTVKREI